MGAVAGFGTSHPLGGGSQAGVTVITATGCGDNFVGGVISSVVAQLQDEKERLDLYEVCSWGVVSGGFTCFYVGGTFVEKHPGEKRNLIIPVLEKYLIQIDHGKQ